jgi:hypothetical protein
MPSFITDNFKRLSRTMRERVKAGEPDPAIKSMQERVRRYRGDAATLVGMGFDEAAAIHSLHTNSGQIDACV